jgi:hypothetical protein
MSELACQCPCGESRFTVRQIPFLRFYCHCEICQNLYGKSYADVTVVRTEDVTLPETGIDFATYRMPPALQRGICHQCHKPVAGQLTSMPGLKLSFISGDNYKDKSMLPAPVGHIFYHRRKADISDSLPKIKGYWRSELQVCRWLFPRLRAGHAQPI